MTRSKDPFQIPKAGLEIAPVAGLASINVNGSASAVLVAELLGESIQESACVETRNTCPPVYASCALSPFESLAVFAYA